MAWTDLWRTNGPSFYSDEPLLRHSAFFATAATTPDDSPEFELLTVGLLVLRLLDRWRARDTTDRDVKFSEFIAVKRRVEAMSEGPARRILAELVNTISAFAYGRSDSRMATLLAFAEILEHASQWEPAADTYRTAIDLAGDRIADRELLPRAYDRAAYCIRLVGRLDEALELVNEGSAIAAEIRDPYWALRLRINAALIEVRKGNLPEAEFQLDAIVEDAETTGQLEMVAWGKHERGHVAYERNENELAATLFHAASLGHTDPARVQRAVLDLALALADLGHIGHAQRAYQVVRNAREDHDGIRALAGINLMRLAHMTDDRAPFEQLRRELGSERMTGRLRAHYHLIAGQGLRRFGDPDGARAAFQRAIEVAEQFKVFKLVVEAEALLNATGDERPRPRKTKAGARALAPILADIDQRRGPFAGAAQD